MISKRKDLFQQLAGTTGSNYCQRTYPNGRCFVSRWQPYYPWWNGRLKTSFLKKASPAITRFVPGREGLGLTDRIDSVVNFMKQKNILVLTKTTDYGTTVAGTTMNVFVAGMEMYGDLLRTTFRT